MSHDSELQYRARFKAWDVRRGKKKRSSEKKTKINAAVIDAGKEIIVSGSGMGRSEL